MTETGATQPSIVLEEVEGKVQAVITPGEQGLELTETWLQQQLDTQGCANIYLFEDGKMELAALLNENTAGLVKVGERRNARVEILISDDAQSASLIIKAPYGGIAAGMPDIVQALSKANIPQKLINNAILIQALIEAGKSSPGQLFKILIASGKSVIHGKDSTFEPLIDNMTDRKPNMREDGSIDYYDKGEILSIPEGTHLMRRNPPTTGENGYTVTGKEIPARIGKLIPFQKCKGAKVSTEDSNILIADIKGQPILLDRGVNVDPVFTVDEVDVHLGNIVYDGSLVVKGTVTAGMKIKVTGDIQVNGMVENATLEAAGNIDIKMGAIGRPIDEAPSECLNIKCAGNLSATYIKNAIIEVEGDVLIKSRLENCIVNTKHQIIAGSSNRPHSGIVGGKITAGSVIKAETLGSSGFSPTFAGISHDRGLLKEKESLHKTMSENVELKQKMKQILLTLTSKQTPEAKQLIEKTNNSINALDEKVNGIKQNITEIDKIIERVQKGKIIIQKNTFPGVTISFNQEKLEIKTTYGNGTFVLQDGKITIAK